MTGTRGETYSLKQTVTTNVNEKAWVSTAITSSGTDTITDNGGYSSMEAAVYSGATGYDSSATNNGNSVGPATLASSGTASDILVMWLFAPPTVACASMTQRIYDGNFIWEALMASSTFSASCTIGYSNAWGAIGVSLK